MLPVHHVRLGLPTALLLALAVATTTAGLATSCDHSAASEGADLFQCDDGRAHYALNPSTGECWSFVNSCPPQEWAACTPCETSAECAGGEECQTQTVLDEDQPTPTPGVCVPTSMGVPEQDAGAAPPPPAQTACSANTTCADGEVCPAQYGRCSPAADAATCPSYCETACWDDTGCATGQRCNAADVCATANPSPDLTPPGPCAGWCEPL